MSNGKDEYPVEDWWQDWQIELVVDKEHKWNFKVYFSEDGFRIERDGKTIFGKLSQHESLPVDAIIEKGIWDHEHCALCNDKIMEGDGFINAGYTDNDNWICPNCFEKYIKPRRV